MGVALRFDDGGTETPPDGSMQARLQELLRQTADAGSVSMASLLAASYRSLKHIAQAQRAGRAEDATLSTTALVNETWLKLQQAPDLKIRDLNHFYSLAARAMRFVLSDYARERLALKRGNGVSLEPIEHHLDLGDEAHHARQMLDLDQAMTRLEQVFPRMAQVVSLRYYVGLSDVEIGTILGIDERTVRRDWVKARGFMFEELGPDGSPEPG